MQELNSLFVGYSSFKSKDNKEYFTIQVLLQDIGKEKSFVKSSLKNIFVDRDTYFTIVNSSKPFDNISIIRVVNTDTDKVYYKIK